jgi:hypothetical protein
VAVIIAVLLTFWVSVGLTVRFMPSWNLAHSVIEQTEHEAITPNYYAIASMERTIWGQTFHNTMSPKVCQCITCHPSYPVYREKELLRPPLTHPHAWEDRYGE